MRLSLTFIFIIALLPALYSQNEDVEITAVRVDPKVQDSINSHFYITHQAEFTSCEAHLNVNNYDSARVCYEAKLLKYPNNNYIYGQIRKSTPKFIYEDLIRKADGYFNQKKWKSALSFYHGAAKIYPTEIYPQNQIKTLKKLIQELEYEFIYPVYREPTKAEIAAAKAKRDSIETQFREEHPMEFKKIDKFQKKGKFNIARKICMNLMMTYKDVDFLGELHKELTRAQVNKDANLHLVKKYKEWIKKADNHFKNKDYFRAKENYLYALNIKPKDEYVVKRIIKIESILKKHHLKEQRKEAKKLKKHKKRFE